jgi:hypothetical protein
MLPSYTKLAGSPLNLPSTKGSMAWWSWKVSRRPVAECLIPLENVEKDHMAVPITLQLGCFLPDSSSFFSQLYLEHRTQE